MIFKYETKARRQLAKIAEQPNGQQREGKRGSEEKRFPAPLQKRKKNYVQFNRNLEKEKRNLCAARHHKQ